jgi:hypothetical protein
MAEESLGSTTRKALIAAVVSILFLPISGILGYMLAKYLQAPRLQILYVTMEVDRNSRPFSPRVLQNNTVDRRPGLA